MVGFYVTANYMLSALLRLPHSYRQVRDEGKTLEGRGYLNVKPPPLSFEAERSLFQSGYRGMSWSSSAP